MPVRVPDLSDFSTIDCGDEITLGDRRFRITGFEKERRFGMEDPKFWVKRATDIDTGERKLLKFAFFETFDTTVGGVRIRCFRNPEKESAILEKMKDHPSFMQGHSFRDNKGNNIRVLDIVRGPSFFIKIGSLAMDHHTYFQTRLADILFRLRRAFGAIRSLHLNTLKHGDIRNDHIIVERQTGNYVWIDFDYDYDAPENPFSLDLLGMGNILLYAMGKGFHEIHNIAADPAYYGDLTDRIDINDFSLLDRSRLVNLKKIYPYIPEGLNDILMHFSRGSTVFYETIDEFMEDLNNAVAGFCLT
ncbi:MAG: protein kinase [Desulfosalsimonas sp.]